MTCETIRLTGGGSTELADSVPSKRALAAAEAVLQHRRIWHAFLGGLGLRDAVAMLIDTERECCAIIAEHYPEAGGAEIAARIRAMR
jgi:hypothetical protein